MPGKPSRISPARYQRATRLMLAGVLAILGLQGCGGLLYSTLTDADIRATAYDIATTRLATTIEVPPQVLLTNAPGAPTATLDPTFCPPDLLAAWKEATLADISILDQEISILIGDEYTPDQLLQMVGRAEQRSAQLILEEEPRCAITANRRLSDVYTQFATTLNVRLSGNLAGLPQEKLRLQQSIQKLMDAIREIIHGEDFRPFDQLLSKYQ